MIEPTDLFHTGIIVDDPHAVMTRLSALFGYKWGEQIGGPITVELADGERTVDLKAWYSTSQPRLEIVESIAGTVWQPSDSGAHHLGYWVADVAATTDELTQHGYRVEAVGKRPGGFIYWSYLRPESGPRVELVSTALRPTMEKYFETGSVSG
ncbi:MAG: VOC family protein [Gordonia sp. (in: high G+C Gram-positive bacteria)]